MAAEFMSARVAVMRSAKATDGSASRPMVRVASPIEPAAHTTTRPDSTASATIEPGRPQQPGGRAGAGPPRAAAASSISAPAPSAASSSPG